MSGKRATFIAMVEKFGKKSAWKGEDETTILLVDIKDKDSNYLEDHAWLVCRKRIKERDLKIGDIIQLDARITMYKKGYSDDDEEHPIRFDYRLSFPTNIIKIGENQDRKELELKSVQRLKEQLQKTNDIMILPRESIAKQVNIHENKVLPEQMKLDDFFNGL